MTSAEHLIHAIYLLYLHRQTSRLRRSSCTPRKSVTFLIMCLFHAVIPDRQHLGKCRSRPYSPDHVSLLQHIMSTNRCLGRSYSQYIQRHYMTSAEQLIHAIYLPRRMSMNVGACVLHAIYILYSHRHTSRLRRLSCTR